MRYINTVYVLPTINIYLFLNSSRRQLLQSEMPRVIHKHEELRRQQYDDGKGGKSDRLTD